MRTVRLGTAGCLLYWLQYNGRRVLSVLPHDYKAKGALPPRVRSSLSVRHSVTSE